MKYIVIICLLALLSGCTGGVQEAPGDVAPVQTPVEESAAPAAEKLTDMVEVEIKDLAYSPREVTIAKGGTVVWVNNDLPKHTVTFEDYFYDVTLEKGGSGQRTFANAGTYNYYCNIHPSMTGTVIVK